MSLLDEIEPLKAEALAELNAATDQAALDRAKGAWLGPQGRFTGLMKQMGSLSKEERPLAGKAINAALAHAGRIHIDHIAEQILGQALRHG